jgi:energy-coupling factor transport system ATP-binding protein
MDPAVRDSTAVNAADSAWAVVARGVGFAYERSEVEAIRDLSLEVPRGRVTAVVGASGAGKSTLCLMLNGLVPGMTRGRMRGHLAVLGQDVTRAEVYEMATRVGMVFQDFEAQLFSTSVEAEVAFGLENLGASPERIRRRVAEALRQVGLAGFERRDPSALSGGEKQRLALASVLAMEPELLVLDEPTSDMDPRGRADALALVRSLAREGRSAIVVEHETDELICADLALLLERGEAVLWGPAGEVFRETGRLAAAGVRPPQLAELASRLGLDALPLSPAEAVELIRRSGYSAEGKAGDDGPQGRPAGEAVVRVERLSHRYGGGLEALHDVTLEIRKGEFVAIVGANGSGKTTLVKHFNGLLRPQDGSVRVFGLDTRRASVSQLARAVGYVFQNPDHQIFSETVAEELAFGPRNMGVDPDEIAARSERALAAVGLQGAAEADPFALTKGERQRVALASVLVMEPSVIVMDEPTTGLDYGQQVKVMELLARLNRAGHTVVVVTHALWLVAQYAGRVIVMSEGRVAADGPTRRILGMGKELAGWSLVPPPVVEVARALGSTAVTVEELCGCLRKRRP